MRTFVANFLLNGELIEFLRAFYVADIGKHCNVIISYEPEKHRYNITIQVEEKYATWAENQPRSCLLMILYQIRAGTKFVEGTEAEQ